MQKTKMKLKIMFDEQYCFPKVLKIQKLVQCHQKISCGQSIAENTLGYRHILLSIEKELNDKKLNIFKI